MTESKIDTLRAGEFILKSAMYEEIRFEGQQNWKVAKILHFDGIIDSYCPGCRKDATFRGLQSLPPNWRQKAGSGLILKPPEIEDNTYRVRLRCTRHAHLLEFYFMVTSSIKAIKRGELPSSDQRMVKIGQYPSFADINLQGIEKYRAVLNADQLREFSRGISLASHDVGIGSFTYLRRVFESLVEGAHQDASMEEQWSEEQEREYATKKMHEKIKTLAHQLPDFLVQHSGIYSVLSKGIHELSEDVCLEHFDVLKAGIELILEEKLEKHQKELKHQEISKAIKKAQSSVSGISGSAKSPEGN